VIHGSGFAPLPTKVLTPPEALLLPQVTLSMSRDLVGSDKSGKEVVYPGKAEEELSDNLIWTSEERLTFLITEDPSVALDPGLYDVTVENPDNRSRATVEQGLAVIPPPSIEAIEPEPPALCVEQEVRQLTVKGSNFLVIGSNTPVVTLSPAQGEDTDLSSTAEDCTEVPGTYVGQTIQLCQTLYLDLPANQPYGPYDIIVTSPEPADCYSTEPYSIAIVPPPSIDQQGIQVICLEQQRRQIVVTGGSFIKIEEELPLVEVSGGNLNASIFLQPDLDSFDGCKPVEGVNSVDSCTSFRLTVDETTLPPDEYTLVITNPQPAGCSTTEEVLSIKPPPEVDTVAPSTVCEGGSRLNITGNGFQDDAVVMLQCPDGEVVNSVTVEVISENELEAVMGPGVSEGQQCDVLVTNPDSCSDESPHEQVTGTAGPFLFMADPFVVYNGINTPITLFLTTITTDSDGDLPDAAVTLVPSGQTESVDTYDARVTSKYPNRAQFTVQNGIPAGQYDVLFEDYSGCFTSLENAFTVTDQNTIEIDRVIPPFGQTDDATAITVFRSGTGDAFEATPRVFLAPSDGDGEAILLDSVSLLGNDTMTAIVPEGTSADEYDIIIVNPNGAVGVISAAYRSLTDPPPVIDKLAPQSLVNNNDPNVLTIKGTDFRNSDVSLNCVDLNGDSVTAPSVTSGSVDCDAEGCEQTAELNASSLADGTVCVVRLTNEDESYAEYSAVGVTNPSLNLTSPQPGTNLNVARRALVASAVNATSAARFVYAIGGDAGPDDAAAPFDSVEFASVDVFGTMREWVEARDELRLVNARAFAAGVTLGRYIYLIGGSDGTDAISNVERTMVLSPQEVPVIRDTDIVLNDTGLDGGLWSYRVSAVISDSDPDNPGGETLASNPFMVRLPSLDDDRKTRVTISWSAPLDVLGDSLENIAGYRVYRTANPNLTAGADEVLLVELEMADLPSLQFTDDGTETPEADAASPLPVGSTGRWHSVASLNTARMGPTAALAHNPASSSKWHIYALLGKSGGSETDGTALTSYEYLTVTVEDNQRHSIDPTGWVEDDTDTASEARWLPGAWVVDASVMPDVGNDSWVYIGGGRTTPVNANNDRTGVVEVAQVNSDGSLAPFGGSPANDMASARGGFSSVTVGTSEATKLLLWGGLQSNPRDNAIGGALSAADVIDNWNNEGLTMQESRYLAGCSVQSAFIFLVGGQVDSGGNVTDSTELVIW